MYSDRPVFIVQGNHLCIIIISVTSQSLGTSPSRHWPPKPSPTSWGVGVRGGLCCNGGRPGQQSQRDGKLDWTINSLNKRNVILRAQKCFKSRANYKENEEIIVIFLTIIVVSSGHWDYWTRASQNIDRPQHFLTQLLSFISNANSTLFLKYHSVTQL